jgi:3',5'-cyclic AMP phosphodiesterase CpdA
MPSPHAITLLHLSDTQFGPHHRFGGLNLSPPDDSFDTLLARLLEDLHTLEQNQNLRPDVILLSGDLTASGKRSEFDLCLKFVEGLVQTLGCPKDKVVIIPGNHDVN